MQNTTASAYSPPNTPPPLLFTDGTTKTVELKDNADVETGSLVSYTITNKGKYLRELHSQMRSMPDVTLKSFFFIPNKQAVTSQYIQFYVNPMYAETTFNYEGKPKKAYFVFYPNSFAGIWTPTKRTFEYQMGLYAICFDKPEINSENTVTTAPYIREIYITCEAR